MFDPASLLISQAENSPHIYFIYDVRAQRMVFINAAYERILGGERGHVDAELPALLARLHPDDLPVWQHYWQLWQKGRLHDEIEVRLQRPDGPEQWLCLTPNWYRDNETDHIWVSGVVRDISVEKQHKQNIDKFNSKKNVVLDMLSHDLAGAFVLLQQLTEYVQEELSELAHEKVTEMLTLMRQTSQKSVALIHNLVDQEFLESAGVPLRRERVDLREPVADCLEPFRRAPGFEARQLRCELPTEPVYADVDITKLLQVITNLVHNALKFTPNDGHILVKVEPCPDCVRIVVSDEGIGIPEALQPLLFERFTAARRPGLRGEPTTGLGLSLCKTIIDLHQGTLRVSSTEGQGTTFTIELPAPTAA